MLEKIKIVFLGTPDIACPFLEKLAQDHRFQLQAVITQEDKPFGRKKILTPPPVKITATQLSLPIFQPIKLNKDEALLQHLTELAPDFLVVVAYGQILNKKVLSLPKLKPINVHGSILPLYRGASPIEQALLNGDKKTGLSIMEMEIKMDTGPVYKILECPISDSDDNNSLRKKLSEQGSAQLPDILVNIFEKKLTAQPQDESSATYCQKISKQDGLIHPLQLTSEQILNRLRAFSTWPGIFLNLQEKNLKLTKLSLNSDHHLSPGQFQILQNRLFLGCQTGTLEILELQMEGKNIQNTASFLNGHRQLFS